MGLDTVTTMQLMETIEKRLPRLINCLGSIDYRQEACNKCKFTHTCTRLTVELKGKAFEKGKYRMGFGRPMVNKKTSDWNGDRDAF